MRVSDTIQTSFNPAPASSASSYAAFGSGAETPALGADAIAQSALSQSAQMGAPPPGFAGSGDPAQSPISQLLGAISGLFGALGSLFGALGLGSGSAGQQPVPIASSSPTSPYSSAGDGGCDGVASDPSTQTQPQDPLMQSIMQAIGAFMQSLGSILNQFGASQPPAPQPGVGVEPLATVPVQTTTSDHGVNLPGQHYHLMQAQ